MPGLWTWLEGTRLATTVGQSLTLTGLLSAIHLVGMTLVAGGAFVAWLRLWGLVLRERPIGEVARMVESGIVGGLCVSVSSGLLLFAPRASAAAASGTFQLKMLMLVVAAVLQLSVFRSVTRRDPGSTSQALRIVAALGPMAWIAVAVAGSAYILLE